MIDESKNVKIVICSFDDNVEKNVIECGCKIFNVWKEIN